MFNGNARFQNVFFENLESKFQWAAFPTFGYFSSRATVWSVGILYRNEPSSTDLSYEFFPNYAQQKGQNLGLSTAFRVYLNPSNEKFYWFLQSSFLFNFRHRNFGAQTNRAYERNSTLISGGINYFITDNVAFELVGNVDVFGNRSIFPTFKLQYFTEKNDRKSRKWDAKSDFVKKGTWSIGIDGGLGMFSFFRESIPTYLKPRFSIFLSERIRFVSQFSFFRLEEDNDRKRIFAQYQPGFEWYIPFFRNSFFAPRFHVLYNSQKEDNQSRVTNSQHLSSGFTIGVAHFFKNASVFMGLEGGVWRNFGENNGTNLDGKLELGFFILPNIKLDVKTNLNFYEPVEYLEELFYSFPVQKAVSFEFGFSFFVCRNSE